jgi:MFS transporter, DHA1 family, multidrug resistance protein
MREQVRGRSFFRLVVILGATNATGPFAIDMYLASFPELVRVFETGVAEVQLGLSMFFVGLALGQLVYGPVIDSFGRKAPLLVGMGVFTLASLLLAVAPNIETFIFLRFLQAIGACAGMIIGRAIINDLFDETEMARVMSLIMLVIALAPVLAPMTGAYIVAHASWHVIFVVLALIGGFCWLAVALGLPETLAPGNRRSLRLGSVLGGYAGVLGNRGFLVPMLGAGFSFGVLFAFIAACPFVYMEVFGVSPQTFGWLFAVNAIGMISGSQLNRLLLSYFPLRRVLLAASALAACATVLLVGVAGSGSLALVVFASFLCLAPTPMIGANSVALALQAAKGATGSASAVVGVGQFGFGAAVSGLVGVIHGQSVYPMAAIMLACACCAFAIFLFGIRWD